jgi:hypothetical protein
MYDEGMSTIFSSSNRALGWYFIGALPPFPPLPPLPPSRRCDLISPAPLSFPDTFSPFTSSSNQSAHYSTILLFAVEHLSFLEWGKRRPEGGCFSDGSRRLKILMKACEQEAFTENEMLCVILLICCLAIVA